MSLAFVTGSQIYGVPDGDSDIDLVIRTSEKHAKMLLMMSDFPEDGNGGKDEEGNDQVSNTVTGSLSLRFGDLNLIACYTDWSYNIWMQGTQQLWFQKPVTRNAAIEHFNMLRGLPNPSGRVQWNDDDIPF